MRIAIDRFTPVIARMRGGICARAVPLFALALFAASPSVCHAQVTGLGSAANYGLLESGGNVTVSAGQFYVFFSVPNNSGDTGNAGFLNSAVNVDNIASFSVDGTASWSGGQNVNTGNFESSYSAGSTSTNQSSALTSAFGAAGTASTNDGALSATTTISSNTITGSQSVNVVDVSSITHDLTISGNANQVFVINVTGNNGNVINLSNVSLSGGVTADHVLFNITGSGNVSLGGGTVNGTFLDTGSGSITLNGTTLNGEIIAGSGGVTVSNSATINADPFSGGGGDPPSAPELPSIAMAGVGCLLVLGRAAVARRKRARTT